MHPCVGCEKGAKILIISIIVYNINIVDTGYTHSTVCIVFIVSFSLFSLLHGSL